MVLAVGGLVLFDTENQKDRGGGWGATDTNKLLLLFSREKTLSLSPRLSYLTFHFFSVLISPENLLPFKSQTAQNKVFPQEMRLLNTISGLCEMVEKKVNWAVDTFFP